MSDSLIYMKGIELHMVSYIVMIAQLALFLLGPLLVPILMKKWRWLLIVAAGYILYLLWGVYLHFTADITDYGTGYGILIVPYLIIISVIGFIVERYTGKMTGKQ